MIAAFAVAVLACFLVGCGDDGVSIKLLRTEITLNVGESRSLLPYVALNPATADSSALKLSTDSDGIEIDGMTVKAVKPCNAKITVSGYNKRAVLSVSVSYREIQSLKISAENAVQTVVIGSPKTVSLSAVFDESISNSVAQWEVNGKTLNGNSVQFTPPDYGEYSVTAKMDGVTANSVIKVYRRTEVDVEHNVTNGAASLFEPLTFTAYETTNTVNPKSVYEWTVNGEVKSDSPILNYTPVKIGEYTISLSVNGEAKKIDGADAFTFNVVKGTAQPARVEFDDLGGVFVRWAAGLDVLWVSISDGRERVILDITDASSSYLFKENSLRATEYIDVCAESPKQYDIALGVSGGRFDFTFDCLEENARKFLDDVVLCKNSFVTDESSARAWVAELYATNKITAECYVLGGAESVVQTVVEQAQTYGISAAVTADGNVLSVSFSEYACAPTKFDSVTKNKGYATLPHIEYSAENRRSNDYVFSSDRANKSVSVSGTEQLLIALLNGYKPTAVKGDIAATVYLSAKRVLLNIIGADYTPRQKIHAIYDWLQYATVNLTSCEQQSAARFLEGVFAGRRTTSGYAVTSEGASKAFMLLCQMEGIPCTLSCDLQSGRFYNKVMNDGLWYNVDVYGGKATGGLNTTQTATEFTSHRGLLISDAELMSLGVAAAGEYEAFDGTATEYMQKRAYDNVYFDNFVDVAEADDYRKVRAAVFYAFDKVTRGTVKVYVGSEVTIYNYNYGVEFAFDASFSGEQKSALEAYINEAIDEYAKSVSSIRFLKINVTKVGNVMIAVAESVSTGA